jgi:hypothetical protein
VSSVDLIYKGVRIAGGTSCQLHSYLHVHSPPTVPSANPYCLALDAAQLVFQISVLELELGLDSLAPPW